MIFSKGMLLKVCYFSEWMEVMKLVFSNVPDERGNRSCEGFQISSMYIQVSSSGHAEHVRG